MWGVYSGDREPAAAARVYRGCRCGGDGLYSSGDGKILIVDATSGSFSGDGGGMMFGCIWL
jgi:hypothetical protein